MKVYGFKVESVFISVRDRVLSLNGLWFYTIAAFLGLNSWPYTYRFPKIDLPVGNDSHSGNAVPTTSSINDINDKILQNKTGIILFLVR